MQNQIFSLKYFLRYRIAKISELKTQEGYNKLSTEYRDILLALTIAEEVFKLKEEIEVFNQDSQDVHRLKLLMPVL